MPQRKRRRLSLEEEIIKAKTEHDMKIENEKLQLERDRLELENKREERLAEEGKRRDGLQASSNQMQAQLLGIVRSMLDSNFSRK